MGEVLSYEDPGAVNHPFHARYATVVAGVPGRCPQCDDFGYIDGADIARGYQNQHCRGCGARWSYAFDGEGRILEVNGLPTLPPASERIANPEAKPETVLDLRSRGPVDDPSADVTRAGAGG